MIDLRKIDTRQGSLNQHSMGHGNTLPYTGFPFGMNHFTLITRLDDVRFFHPEDYQTWGVRLTHQPSPWMGDFFPATFNYLQVNEEEYERLRISEASEVGLNQLSSYFRPHEARFNPHYLRYKTLRNELEHEWTVSKWGARYKVSTRKTKFRQFFTLLVDQAAQVDVDEQEGIIRYLTHQRAGSKYHKGGQYGLIKAGAHIRQFRKDALHFNEKEYFLYYFEFQDIQNTRILDLTTSYLSFNQAVENKRHEEAFFGGDFSQSLEYSQAAWRDYLQRIEVEDEDAGQVATFYHCLYRTATFPQRAYELNEEGQPIHYSFYTGKEEPGYAYTNNGYWDTFRTSYPLYTLIAPEMVNRFIQGIAAIAREDKYLPKWLSPDERGLMPGTLVDGVIADAIVKGLVDRKTAKFLLEAMIFTASHEGSHETEGREGVAEYESLGYLPSHYHESVNKTLDFTYSDFCIHQVAAYLGEDDLADKYETRARAYRNLFDLESGLMKPRDSQGKRVDSILSDRWGQHYTEGSAWQNSWFVPHNVGDLIRLHGGDQAFANRLETLINQVPTYDVTGYGYEIHEMAEMAVLDFGQLALSNQPSFHLPYLYIYAGYPHLSQMLIKHLVTACFTTGFKGFIGDEDNGSMSAWYVLSSLGLYPLTPGSGQWTLGISNWEKASVHIKEGQRLEITSLNRPNPYLQVVSQRWLDEKEYLNHFIWHADLLKVNKLEQRLGVLPSLDKVGIEYRPYSLDGYPSDGKE